MAKVLLINPETSPAIPKEEAACPMGLLWMGSYIEQNGHDAVIVSSHDQPDYLDLIKKEMKGSVFAGLSVMTAQIPQALDIARFIRENDADLPIVWGGIHATLLPEQTCRNSLVDMAIVGEGEETLLDLVKHFEGRKDVKDVDGIYKFDRKKNEILATKPRRIFNMDALESVKWGLLDKPILEKLSKASEGFPVNVGRGCPHRCSFCVNTALGGGWRVRSVENVFKDLEEVRALGVENIKFRDDNFFVNPFRVEKIVDGMLDREFGFKWFANIRADYLRQGRIGIDLIRKSRDAGWKYASLGLESGSERVLKILKKDITLEDSMNAANVLGKVSGIVPCFSFMIGIPGETREDMLMTVRLIDRIINVCPNAEFFGPQIFRPYPGCELYTTCVKSGWEHPDTLERWKELLQSGDFYTSADRLPWVKDPDLAEIIIASVPRFKGLRESMKEHRSSLQKLLTVLLFIDGKVRWKTKYFGFPVEIGLKRRLKSKKRSAE